ncbi:MAG: type II toxin-antitoxin system HicA family toxin [Myxococcota bacterium]
MFEVLQDKGWTVKRTNSSRKLLEHPNHPDFSWPFDDDVELGKRMLRRIGEGTGINPMDFQ